MIKFAFGSVPKDGGTFTFYRNMRPSLLKHGIDMRCVSVGSAQAELWEDAYDDEGCVLLAANTRNIKKQAMAFAEWCEAEQVDIVMGINSEAILSALPHLPERIRCMSRCANSFDHGYRITLSGYERLAGIIAQTPRQLKDLTETYGADPERITVIPNGIDPEPFADAAATSRGEYPELRLGFLGRLEHNQKGVLFLPRIVDELNKLGVNYTLRIAGKGKHEKKLKEEMQKVESGTGDMQKVEFLGAIGPDEVLNFLAETDVFLFPSQFEGCPNALLEAMMAGCVPVSWNLKGITDYIIKHESNGYLVELGDTQAFANVISELCCYPEKIQSLSEAASLNARDRFSCEIAARNYARIINKVMNLSEPKWHQKPWDDFCIDPNFSHGLKDYLPAKLKQSIKNFLSVN